MTSEELCAELYQRMDAEQDQYRDWLLGRPPNEILNHAYEYATRQDIVVAMEELELTAAQAKALLRSKAPLEDVFKAWCKTETGYMDDVRSVIEARANSVIQAEKEKAQREER